jgi:hypothetical protein
MLNRETTKRPQFMRESRRGGSVSAFDALEWRLAAATVGSPRRRLDAAPRTAGRACEHEPQDRDDDDYGHDRADDKAGAHALVRDALALGEDDRMVVRFPPCRPRMHLFGRKDNARLG